ncbi:MAG TPA: excinuclease ABC subunit A [Bacteroidales bacterium]|nr:excinuclease ABC subunit A [Bacteroidales bacterium]
MTNDPLHGLDPKKYILIKDAHIHNLKHIDLAIPRNKFVVMTGLSGSGKSSLAFDTLFAEGQRRYVESLSSYARQFLGRMDKPEVEYIKGISPAIAIEQKVISRNPRSTVGTSTEIYEYFKLLFARIGKTYSPVSGQLVKRHSIKDVLDFVLKIPVGTRFLILTSLSLKNGRTLNEQLQILVQQGFNRVKLNGNVLKIEEAISNQAHFKNFTTFDLVVDRLNVEQSDDFMSRVSDSVQTAFYEGHGNCSILVYLEDETEEVHSFSNLFEKDGMSFEEPTTNLFAFNNPFGACKKCDGFGTVIGIDPDMVIPNKSLSVYQEAIAPWKGEKMGEWRTQLIMKAEKFNFPIHKPISELSKEQYQLLWQGNKYFEGLDAFFQQVEEQSYKIQYRVMMSRYRGKTICPDCEGTRLRKDASYVKVGGKSISDLVRMPLDLLQIFMHELQLDDYELAVSKRILEEINRRIRFLLDVGLSYLSLNRLSNSLSGGESQRINLATSLGSSLVGSIYILDEPSIGLHSRDTKRLIKVLKNLRDIGNTVIVVEHDEEIIRAADYIIDIGPFAGYKGGEVVFAGNLDELKKDQKSLTAQYISGNLSVNRIDFRRPWRNFIEVKGARENNLKNINLKIPLNILTLVTGVSGSGKTSLIKNILYPALKKHYGGFANSTGKFDSLGGDLKQITDVELIDQNPIGRSSRSNPATYVKAWDEIRTLFSSLKLAKVRGYKPGFFSFNIPGGRCETCEGDGQITVEMQFMADIHLVCDECHGKRFKEEVLDVKYHDKNVHDILEMTINQVLDFFVLYENEGAVIRKIISRFKPLQDVGLGYLKVGQPSSTLSGGEAQRIKLASFLAKGEQVNPILFIFDEPTTGLHFYDINNLLKAFYALIENGHSLVVIEHNMELIKSADWIIDLGPEGGDKGGEIVFEGIPESLLENKNSYTAKNF